MGYLSYFISYLSYFIVCLTWFIAYLPLFISYQTISKKNKKATQNFHRLLTIDHMFPNHSSLKSISYSTHPLNVHRFLNIP